MLNSSDLSFSRTLPTDVFNQLGELLEQMAQAVGSESMVLTEAVLTQLSVPDEWQKQKFTIVISKGFSALLVGKSEEMGEFVESGKQRRILFSTPVAGQPPQLWETPHAIEEETHTQQKQFSYSKLNVHLTFDSQAIASFTVKLQELFRCDSQQYHKIEHYRQILAPNDVKLQSQFTLLLLEVLLPQINQEIAEPQQVSITPDVSVCQPVEDALTKQLAQERLLNQVTTQIRQSLDLSVIMVTAIEQVQKFLELDRLVICKLIHPQEVELFDRSEKFNPPSNLSVNLHPAENLPSDSVTFQFREQNQQSPKNEAFSLRIPNFDEVNSHTLTSSASSNLVQHSSCIIYESRAKDDIPSVLNYQEDHCFAPNSPCWEKYRQGFTVAVDDVEKTYALEECFLSILRNIKVRAKFVAPIVFEDELWGLLIAHQCHTPRHWTENEKSLLTSIAEQLAIAIHQAELTRSLTQEKQSLEQRVIERTMALHDALVAAEAASRLRSEFLATISHELLTPLTHVIGMSSTLLRWSFGELNQRQREYLQTIHDSGEHLLEMINDILELSQIEAGKAVLNITEFSLADIAKKTVASLLEKATSQQVNLKLDLLIDQQRDRFSADVRRVEQILWNLLTNAIKFTPEGGNVTLRLWVEDDTAVFQIEDTGIGIPQEQLPLLFEKFHQLDTPYRRRYEGTGLGLALTKQLVELHRGRIEVESTVGVGSVFTVWLPIQPEPVFS
ncbi:GAF domain-containing sensor histidine kinase [Fischerella sp. PCC 9605]|uniref:GAF domain-containing sensor histidine kinase n=1 Tax=Fischerella sp. PCC 9605 TaxID=1173024 RepID=UPI00047CAF00|nr:GAF domain-containing sensor histidine kinase [Fischerella sp. PCC 9605]